MKGAWERLMAWFSDLMGQRCVPCEVCLSTDPDLDADWTWYDRDGYDSSDLEDLD